MRKHAQRHRLHPHPKLKVPVRPIEVVVADHSTFRRVVDDMHSVWPQFQRWALDAHDQSTMLQAMYYALSHK